MKLWQQMRPSWKRAQLTGEEQVCVFGWSALWVCYTVLAVVFGVWMPLMMFGK